MKVIGWEINNKKYGNFISPLNGEDFDNPKIIYDSVRVLAEDFIRTCLKENIDNILDFKIILKEV